MIWIALFYTLFVGTIATGVVLILRGVRPPAVGSEIIGAIVLLLLIGTGMRAMDTAREAFLKSWEYAGYLSLFLFFVVGPCLAIWYRRRRPHNEESWDGPSTH